MQLALGAIGKLFGGGLAAKAGAGAAAGGIGSSGVLTVLSGIATAVKVIGSIQAANASANSTIQAAQAAAAASEQQATQADLQGEQDKLRSTQRQTVMKQELLRVLGENDVSFANAGIDVSFGAAQQSATTAKKRAQQEISIDRGDQEFQSALYRLRAQGLRAQAASQRSVGYSTASAQRSSGLVNALGTGLDFGISLAARG